MTDRALVQAPMLGGRWQTGAMGSYAEILIAFAMVGLLGLILRFTFGREVPNAADDLTVRQDDGTLDLGDDSYTVVSEDPAPASAAVSEDDFGLLAPVAVTDDPEEAARLKARLTDARIRATTTQGSDGRHRVLVFASELDRARRVGGST
jgi:hypothetical protein